MVLNLGCPGFNETHLSGSKFGVGRGSALPWGLGEKQGGGSIGRATQETESRASAGQWGHAGTALPLRFRPSSVKGDSIATWSQEDPGSCLWPSRSSLCYLAISELSSRRHRNALFSVGLAVAPKGIFEGGPSRNWTHPPVSLSCAGDDVRVRIRKHLGMLGLGHNCGPFLRWAGEQAEEVGRPPV